MSNKTVRVRIAVAVDHKGNWASCGWGPTKTGHDDMMGMAVETLESGEARYWLEADLRIPESKVVIPVIAADTTEE